MPIEVIMPKVDMDMASGKVMTWHVAEGEAVEKGAPLFDIETDKAAMEVESPGSGILHHTIPEGTDVPIGAPVAWLYAEGETVGDPPSAPSAPETSPSSAKAASSPQPAAADETPEDAALVAPAAPASSGEKSRATPLARSLARDGGLDIAALAGSGPQGRVQADDVRAALDSQQPPPAPLSSPVSFTAETGALAVSRSKGGSGTPVVLIHGFAGDALSFAPIEAHLKHRPLVRIELPGHGKSPKLKVGSFAELVRLLRQAFDDLHLDSAHLVGHSLGGALSLALADTRPRNVASLSLIAPAGLGPDVNGAVLSGISEARQEASLGPWLRALVADETLVTDAFVRLAMAPRMDANLRAAQAALADVLFPDGVQAFDLRAALERTEMPVRIIWGKQDQIIPWRHALRAPGRAALHLFDGVGHIPHLEVAEEVGKILKASL